MSLWAKAQQLPVENLQQIRAIYGDHFPIEVRHYLAQYIEEKFGLQTDPSLPNTPQHEIYIADLVNDLIEQIENKAAVVTDAEYFLAKLKLAETAKMFREKYSGNPIPLYNYVRQCLTTEAHLVEAACGGSSNMSIISNPGTEIVQEINVLQSKTQSTAQDLRKMGQEQESFALQYHEYAKMNAHLQQLSSQLNNPQSVAAMQSLQGQKEMLKKILKQNVANLTQATITIGGKLTETFRLLTQLQSHILDEELVRWKREQQLSVNGAIFNNNLDTIQGWCESLVELIWLNREQIKEADRLKQKLSMNPPLVVDVLPQLLAEITQLLSTLVTSTFIIEKQPPQVLKKVTRFSATVQLLVGGKLKEHMSPPEVKVTIISEAQVNKLLKKDKFDTARENSGELLNNSGTMEYQQATRQLSLSLRNMQLKSIRRAEKKGTESVMDAKFSLLFRSQFSVGGGELTFQVWTLSLPVAVIVHGNQDHNAWATVTWDNAFSEPGRVPFTVPDKVLWPRVAETLSMKFQAASGRPLTNDHLKFLAEKALRSNLGDYSNAMLSWTQFCKEPVNDENVSFWEWFYATMKLTKDHLKDLWVDGAIMGFVKKVEAEELLSSCACGTFLLRFSDSEPGGITIAWKSESGAVFSLKPFTSKDFAIRPLADVIKDLSYLVYLYPNISKDAIFGKYYSPYREKMSNKGYVTPDIQIHVPGFTRQSFLPAYSTPDPHRDTSSVVSSYADSMATTTTSVNGNYEMDYVLDDNFAFNGVVNINELMAGFKP